jgi:hypothetical protein
VRAQVGGDRQPVGSGADDRDVLVGAIDGGILFIAPSHLDTALTSGSPGATRVGLGEYPHSQPGRCADSWSGMLIVSPARFRIQIELLLMGASLS